MRIRIEWKDLCKSGVEDINHLLFKYDKLEDSRRVFFDTLGRLILALVKFCDFEIFRFSVYFNLPNSWKISELEKIVSDMVFSECDSTCVKLKRVTTCMKILYLVNP